MKTSGQLPVLIFGLCLFIISVCGLPIKGEGNPENGPHPGLEDIGEDLKHTCVKEGKNPPGEFHEQLEDECICTITNGPRPGHCLMMWISISELVCSQCCKDHYWDKILKKCKECGPSGTREDSNIATNCLPRPEWKSKNSNQKTPSSNKDEVKNNENPTVESIPVSTVTPMEAEVAILPDTSTAGNAGKTVDAPEEDTAKHKSNKSEPIPIIPWYCWLIGVVVIAVIVMIGVKVCHLKKWCWFGENESNAIKQSELGRMMNDSEST